MKRTRKCWSLSIGERGQGNMVRVYEARPGGPLMRSIFIHGKENRKSLGHRDKRMAIQQAHELSARLLAEEMAIEQGSLTLGMLMRLYLDSPAHFDKKERTRKEDEKRLKRVVTFWGISRKAEALTESDVRRFIAARRKGDIELLGVAAGVQVRDRSIQADLVATHTMLNWAARERDRQGRRLLTENPLRGMKIPAEKNPVRPVATHDEYEKLLAVSPTVHPLLHLALLVAEATGRRISAIRQLRWSNLELDAGTIHWPEDTDKKGYQQDMPISEEVRSEFVTARNRAGAIGGAWVFPAPKDPSRPCDRHLLDDWLRKAYALAEVEPKKGGLWHPFRGKWATERKDYPVVDVAAAGGWKDLRTVQGVYQQADAATVRKVVLEPTHRLRSGS